eukprot:COSAG01_NODE_4598_length_4887_cov_8.259816_1_plen_478_part_10
MAAMPGRLHGHYPDLARRSRGRRHSDIGGSWGLWRAAARRRAFLSKISAGCMPQHAQKRSGRGAPRARDDRSCKPAATTTARGATRHDDAAAAGVHDATHTTVARPRTTTERRDDDGQEARDGHLGHSSRPPLAADGHPLGQRIDLCCTVMGGLPGPWRRLLLLLLDAAAAAEAAAAPDGQQQQRPSFSFTCADTMLNARTQFGCVADGQADDSAALQAAIDAAVRCRGKTLFLPVGTYRINRQLNISGHMQIIGEGASGSCHGLGNFSVDQRGTVILQTNPRADGIFVSVGSQCESVQLRDFSIVARPIHSEGAAIRVVGTGGNNMVDGKFQRLLVENWGVGVHCLACQNAALTDIKIRRPWGVGVIIEGDPAISWDQDAAGDSRIAGLDFFGCQRNGAGGGHDGCHSHAAIEYRNGGSWFISQSKFLLGDYGLLLNQTRGPTGTLLVTGNSFEEHEVSSIAFTLAKPEKLPCEFP